MEGEFIIVSLITSCFGLLGLWMVNQNWYKRQKMKYNYQVKRAKLSQKLKVPVKEDKGILDQATQWLPLLRGLDGDQIGELADRFLGGGGEEISQASGGLEGILDNIPPEMINSFLKGLSKKDETKAVEQVEAFPNQV